MSVVIKVESLSKKYVIRHQKQNSYETFRDVLTASVKKLGKKISLSLLKKIEKNTPTLEEFWALNNISFEVEQGDRIGIIGRNGAGKSTLLKILSRITEPTKGRAIIKGKVSSLLEVGTGFHPELTGRENIFLNGAILGMSKSVIKKRFDDIVAFAEVEKFLDTPVKRYSSGMYVRLAFAVAAHLETEIMIVDEVLAVGDAQFQKKCLGKMEEVGQNGKTILFVSHNMNAINRLCTSGILLRNGKKVLDGKINDVVNEYLNVFRSKESFFKCINSPNNIAWIDSARLRTDDFKETDTFLMSDSIGIDCILKIIDSSQRFHFSVTIYELDGSIACHCPSSYSNYSLPTEVGTYKLSIMIPPLNLCPGQYWVQLTLSKKQGQDYEIIHRVEEISFNIIQDFRLCEWSLMRNMGLFFTFPHWSTEIIE